MTPAQRTAIEQAIARGETLDRIVDGLGVTERMVDATLARMDAAAAEGPRVLAPHGTHAAFVRHRAHGETPCDACKAGEHEFRAARWRREAA